MSSDTRLKDDLWLSTILENRRMLREHSLGYCRKLYPLKDESYILELVKDLESKYRKCECEVQLNNNEISYCNLGEILRELGRIYEAVYILTISIEIKHSPRAFFNLAECYTILKEDLKAFEYYKRAFELDKDKYKDIFNKKEKEILGKI